jgi:GNAT superfamily N-acetyltransferase
MTDPFPLVDLALARRLERAEGRAGAAFVASRARAVPEVGATWSEIAGALAMYDGVGSPITQTFALGVVAPPSDDDLAALEEFFFERGAEVNHEISPLAGVELFGRLVERGYRPVELTSVMYQPIGGTPRESASGPVTVRRVGRDESALWATTAAQGWATEGVHLEEFMRAFGAVTAAAEGTECFVAELDGTPVAAAALAIHDAVALLAGASTRPEWRGRGAQAALLRARLRHAAESGCDLAMMGALPGSASQRNAERQGFRIAYTRVKWMRPARD